MTIKTRVKKLEGNSAGIKLIKRVKSGEVSLNDLSDSELTLIAKSGGEKNYQRLNKMTDRQLKRIAEGEDL